MSSEKNTSIWFDLNSFLTRTRPTISTPTDRPLHIKSSPCTYSLEKYEDNDINFSQFLLKYFHSNIHEFHFYTSFVSSNRNIGIVYHHMLFHQKITRILNFLKKYLYNFHYSSYTLQSSHTLILSLTPIYGVSSLGHNGGTSLYVLSGARF